MAALPPAFFDGERPLHRSFWTTSMAERRLEATVIGPSKSGFLKVSLGRAQGQFISDVPADRLPSSLRLPNSQFVAVVEGRELVRVEADGEVWLKIQDEIRSIINESWAPIGAGASPDEYDGYIGELYRRLQREETDELIVQHLRSIEIDWMGLSEPSIERLREVVRRLRQLKLPGLGTGNPTA